MVRQTKHLKKGKTPAQMAQYRAKLTADELINALVAESPIKGETSALLLAEAVTELRFQLQELSQKRREGTIKVDEARTLPALASNMRRLLEELKTTGAAEQEWEFSE